MKKKMFLLGGAIFALSTGFAQNSQEPVRFSSDEEKVRWVNEHPEEYQRISGQEIKKIDRPVEFRSDEEKSAYLRANGLGDEMVILEISGFPKYIDTGDSEADKADYARRKDLWIEQNRSRYENISAAPKENLTHEERLQKGEIIIRN